MLSIVLSNKPANWEETDYNNVRFKTFVIPSSGLEYHSVAQQFGQFTPFIESVTRVQHIYAFGRYLLQRAKFILCKKSSIEKLVYHVIRAQDLTVALEYNCDSRRYMPHINESIIPIFHASPPFITRGDVVIILRILQDEKQVSDSCYYPAYVVHFTL